MRFIPNNTRFDFYGKRWIAYVVTIFFVLASIASLATKGLNLGLDFTGGMVVEVVTRKQLSWTRCAPRWMNRRCTVRWCSISVQRPMCWYVSHRVKG